jgi:stage II sporulation protein D
VNARARENTMRRLLALAVLVGALVGVAAASGSPPSPTAFVLAGGGWGHGVGMSQWGAFGQARAGRDYRAILAHYYPGTTLGPSPLPVPPKLRVLVADGLASVSVTAPGAIAVVDGGGARVRVDRTLSLGPKLVLGPPPGPASDPVRLASPVTLRPVGAGRLVVGGKAYRGALRIVRSGQKLQLVNVVALESYLLGVVPGEMPKDWPLEALKAQAVAARTYAIANLVEGRAFDLYSDARSQLYYGADAEAPGTTRAVSETRGQVLSFDGAPAETFYFSSSGGKTLSALDAFGQDLPYLVSVDDPWDETSPNHRWQTQVLGGDVLARRLGLRSAVTDVAYEPGTPGTPAALRLTTSEGGTTERRLADVRNQLGLKSLEFTLGVLRLDRPAETVRKAGPVRLTGIARDVADVVLERRTPAGDWVQVARVAPTRDGTFALRVRIAETTAYRLTAGGVAGPTLTLRIAA